MENAQQDYNSALRNYDDAQTGHNDAMNYLSAAKNHRNSINRDNYTSVE
ncbi:hypothetical protein phytr_30 [Candidatus Phycorickettsia trachydisci]|uniref:Uncharacterized protein n=1 Tax=Candidatus Phycorickettsia trachydisci TaxID=2115978 RepID=A0A2P1P6T5_9RICK|nr:hypothetical protein [Candidatus Phycorickettsia trachydisci]AVP86967.1 hypothetical protein phytr_30 [Candidatus Phycorickettsia trachydisci]